MESKNIKYLPGLDHIRAYATILIVIYHSILFISYDQKYKRGFALDEWIYTENFLSPLLIEGHTAVALFMVLSGFLFYLITYEKKIFYWKFIQNRILRIYPLFLFLIFVGISSYSANFDFIIFLKTIFGFSNMPPILLIGPYNAVSWAISVEFMFYLIFPFLIKIIKSKRDFFMLILLFLIFRILSYLAGCSPRDITYGTILGRMDQFIIGMFVSHMYIKFQNSNFEMKKRMFVFFLLSILLIFTSMFYYNQFGGWIKDSWWKIIWTDIEAVVWSIFIFTYINLFNKKNFFLNKIGELSFSIYLVHSIVIYILIGRKFYIIFSNNTFLNSILNGIVVVLPITILVSLLTYNYIEKPFLKMRVVYSEKLI